MTTVFHLESIIINRFLSPWPSASFMRSILGSRSFLPVPASWPTKWTIRFFSALSAHEIDTPHDKVAEAVVRYGATPAAGGGVYFDIRRKIINEFPSRFTVAIVREVFPDAPEHTILRVLNELRDEGAIISNGRGKGSYWEKSVGTG